MVMDMKWVNHHAMLPSGNEKLWKITMLVMGKSTISMGNFQLLCYPLVNKHRP